MMNKTTQSQYIISSGGKKKRKYCEDILDPLSYKKRYRLYNAQVPFKLTISEGKKENTNKMNNIFVIIPACFATNSFEERN